MTFRSRVAIASLVTLVAAIAQGQGPQRLYQHVAVSPTHLAFTLGGQLYEVPVGGGTAVRLSRTPDDHARPLYAPDGRRIAYARANALWTIPSGGGTPTRLTYYPRALTPTAWSPDGREILFVSSRDGDGNQRAIVVPADGGPERMLPLNPVRYASYAPSGTQLAVVGWSPFLSGVDRRYYRGGLTDGLRLLDPRTGTGRAVPLHGANAIAPMWIGGSVYYLADSLGSFNLAVYDTTMRRTRYLTQYRSHGIIAASGSAAGGTIAFVRDGRIHVYDLATRQLRTPDIAVAPDTAAWARRTVTAQQGAASVIAGPRGEQVAVELRGEVLVSDTRRGTTVNLSQTPGAADRTPVIAPDGRSVAWFSDASGEYALRVAPIDGSAPGRTIALGATPTYFRGITWSPDGRFIAFSDQRLTLWLADVTAGVATPIDSSRWIAQGLWQTSWSPNSEYLAYAKASPAGIRAIWVRHIASGRREQLSRGGADDVWPVFDPSGRWLYFGTSTTSALAPARDVWALQSDMFLQPFVTHQLVVAPLRAGDVLPVLPFSGAANPMASGPAMRGTYDIAQAGARAIPLPVPAQRLEQLWMSPTGALVAQVTRWAPTSPFDNSTTELLRIDLAAAQRPVSLATGVDGAELSVDGSVAVVTRNGATTLVTVATGASTPLDLTTARVDVDPRAEWRQMYDEAFRMMRDYFYDPGHHGANITQLREHYRAYLPSLTRRAQLNDLLLYAFGEVSVSHLSVSRGDDRTPAAPAERIGVLGADVAVAGNRFRLTRILRNGPYFASNALVRAPLDVGDAVREGDIILAIDSTEVLADRPLEAYLVGKAGRPTALRVARSADGADARTVTIVPSPGENALRRANWARTNAQRVAERTRGAVAYVYVDQWSPAGMAELARALSAAGGARALIIDERFNGGGITADDAIGWLERQPWYDYLYRYGDGFAVPQHLITGPKVLITNETNFSAAETFALMFQERKVGTIVGRRTGGGGIGGALFSQRLIDGGTVTIPNRASHNSRLGTWGVENHGVVPDIDVPITQEDAVAGRDPQLERAIDAALTQLARYRGPVKKRPAMPVHPRRG
ncbi:MAG: PDZ domain-containing protein [Gemmatimonadetes bacterium]|nr:PDZ domain-containing protein [Gemmatimonadota bacterium]